MPRARDSEKPLRPCPGGFAFARRKIPHELGKIPDILCINCKRRLGCSWCVGLPCDVACNHCHDWGTKEALGRHGRLLPEELRADAIKILFMIVGGRLTEKEGSSEFAGLWTVARSVRGNLL